MGCGEGLAHIHLTQMSMSEFPTSSWLPAGWERSTGHPSSGPARAHRGPTHCAGGCRSHLEEGVGLAASRAASSCPVLLTCAVLGAAGSRRWAVTVLLTPAGPHVQEEDLVTLLAQHCYVQLGASPGIAAVQELLPSCVPSKLYRTKPLETWVSLVTTAHTKVSLMEPQLFRGWSSPMSPTPGEQGLELAGERHSVSSGLTSVLPFSSPSQARPVSPPPSEVARGLGEVPWFGLRCSVQRRPWAPRRSRLLRTLQQAVSWGAAGPSVAVTTAPPRRRRAPSSEQRPRPCGSRWWTRPACSGRCCSLGSLKSPPCPVRALAGGAAGGATSSPRPAPRPHAPSSATTRPLAAQDPAGPGRELEGAVLPGPEGEDAARSPLPRGHEPRHRQVGARGRCPHLSSRCREMGAGGALPLGAQPGDSVAARGCGTPASSVTGHTAPVSRALPSRKGVRELGRLWGARTSAGSCPLHRPRGRCSPSGRAGHRAVPGQPPRPGGASAAAPPWLSASGPLGKAARALQPPGYRRGCDQHNRDLCMQSTHLLGLTVLPRPHLLLGAHGVTLSAAE